METGPQLKRLIGMTGEAGNIAPDPGLHGKWFIHYTTAAHGLDNNKQIMKKSNKQSQTDYFVCTWFSCPSNSVLTLNELWNSIFKVTTVTFSPPVSNSRIFS